MSENDIYDIYTAENDIYTAETPRRWYSSRRCKWVGVLINELDGMFLVLSCSYRLRWFILGLACKSVVYLGDNNPLGW